MVASPPALRTDAERRRFVRYTRTQQWPMLQRFPVADELHVELLAQMLACPPVRAAAFVDSLREEARATAARMVADERFRAALAALPFGAGDRIVAIGDSITADRVGWVELLAAATEITGSTPAVLHNLGISGNTTADVLERFDLVEALRPSLVLLMLGTNDARSHGRGSSHRMVTPEETERNLRALIELVTVDLKAAVTVVTPPAIDPARVTGYFAGQPLRWEAITVAEVAAIVRAVAPDCLDLHTAMLEHGLADLIEDDGVHPTIAGQRFILERVVAHLTMAGRR